MALLSQAYLVDCCWAVDSPRILFNLLTPVLPYPKRQEAFYGP